STKGYELSVSKGFAMFTPYAGIASIKVETTATGFTKSSSTLAKTFYGFNMALGLMNIAVEGDSTGGINSYGAKVGFRF
ncbi:MAG: hypothetical protein OQK25_07940, partial [Gammaproteobacteria bacterium]|nr:hypothetical protein [Gammaproteobacteria bacterium]